MNHIFTSNLSGLSNYTYKDISLFDDLLIGAQEEHNLDYYSEQKVHQWILNNKAKRNT